MKICELNLEVKHAKNAYRFHIFIYLSIYLSDMDASNECVNFYRDCCKKKTKSEDFKICFLLKDNLPHHMLGWYQFTQSKLLLILYYPIYFQK